METGDHFRGNLRGGRRKVWSYMSLENGSVVLSEGDLIDMEMNDYAFIS